VAAVTEVVNDVLADAQEHLAPVLAPILDPLGDIVAGALENPLDLGGITEPLQDVVGDLTDGLLGPLLGNPADPAADSDIALGVDLDLAGIDIVDIDLDIPLDPLEAVIGDIDLGLGINNNLLGDGADPLIDLSILGGDADHSSNDSDIVIDLGALDLLQGGGVGDVPLVGNLLGDGNNPIGDLTGWTENALPDLSSLIAPPTIPAVIEPVAAVLQAPIGNVAEGLGGLLGGHHGSSGHHGLGGFGLGGLFG
jgi:hypothetical protein